MDSLSLLHFLKESHDLPKNSLRALHVHHGLSTNADEWAAHCQSMCGAWRIPLTIVRVEVERNSCDGLEAAARRARHAAFEAAGADWVVLAHHQGDQAETLLFNLLRGSGVRGAGAMRMRQGRYLRPWLGVGRGAIERYAMQHGLRWIEDESNSDTRHTRNFLRHRVFPVMRERFPAADARLAAAAGRFANAQELLDDLALIDLGDATADFPIPINLLAGLSAGRARNLLGYLLRMRGVAIPSEERLNEALRQLLSAAPDRHPAIAFGEYHLVRQRGVVRLLAEADINNENGGVK